MNCKSFLDEYSADFSTFNTDKTKIMEVFSMLKINEIQ